MLQPAGGRPITRLARHERLSSLAMRATDAPGVRGSARLRRGGSGGAATGRHATGATRRSSGALA